MKRLISLFILVAMALVLTGCGQSEDALNSATPPPAEETPIPILSAGEYEYEKMTNAALAVGILYPTHWINEPGRQTITYREPVDEGELGARFAITMKQLKKAPGNSGIRTQFKSYLEVLGEYLDDFVYDENVSSSIKLMKRKAYNTTYTATASDGTPIKGFAILTYVSKEKMLYALNFSAPADRYDELQPVLQNIVTNCITLV